MSCRWVVAVLLGSFVSVASAQMPLMPLNRMDQLPRAASSDPSILPIFSQLFLYALPDEFRTVNGGTTHKGHFVQQSVLAKESLQRWTQMISVTGDEAQAFSGRTYPLKLVDDFGARIKKSCGESFAMAKLEGVFVGSYDTVVGVFGCGNVGGQSETTMQMVIKGGMDMYTLEWTVRGPASRTPVKIDEAQWTDRLRRLGPIRLCSIVAGEQPPYPSCLRRR